MTIKKATKPMMAHYEQYLRSTATDLYDVYKSPSRNKHIAMYDCLTLRDDLNGRDLRIISYNCQAFTVGFTFPHPKTGELCFAYITKDHNRYCFV